VARVHGAPIATIEHARRPGDPPALIADARKIRDVLGWQPRCDDLDFIVSTALAWERKLAASSQRAVVHAYG